MGQSLIGKLLRNQAPVALTQSRRPGLSTSLSTTNLIETCLRAYLINGTVNSIVSLLATTTARPEWHLYRKTTDNRRRYTTVDSGSDQRVEVLQHQALSVLNKPNPFNSRFTHFELSQTYIELAGESPWLIERDPRATFPVGLWSCRPDRLEPVPDAQKYLAGWIYTSPDGEKVPLRTNEVIMIKTPNPVEPLRGAGVVQSIMTDIQAAQYAAEWNRNWFVNSATPGGIIQVPGNLSDEEFDQFEARWRETHQGVAKAGHIGMLENGAIWVPNSMSLRDMDFANLRGVSRDIIREAWRVAKTMLGNSDDVNRANAETAQEVFAVWQNVPRLDRLRDALNNQYLPLFGSTGQGVEFDYVTPVPINREQSNAELIAKANAAVALIGAGFDEHDVLEVVGLPDMATVAKNTTMQLPSAAQPDGGESTSPDQADDVTNRLRKVLANGHQLVPAGRH